MINIFNWGRRMNKNANPTFGLAELRSEIERAVESARAAGLRHYVIELALQDAAKVVATRHAMTTPIL
jgi:hypothetical protein